MKIEDKRLLNTKCFKFLKLGDVFCYKDRFYMKTCECDRIDGNTYYSGNCVCFSGADSGWLCDICDNEIVNVVDAILVINPEVSK